MVEILGFLDRNLVFFLIILEISSEVRIVNL